MAEKNVWFVMKDPGGTNNVLPVALYMRKFWGEYCKIHIIADQNGKANEVISKYVPQFLEALSPGYCYDILGSPDLIITSMCSGENLGRSLITEFRDKCTTVAMPDSPWGRYQKEWSDLRYRPGYLIVNDQICKDNALKIWTDYDLDYIKIFGWPYLDQYFDYDVKSARRSVREFCGSYFPVVTFIGQLDGTSKVLREVILALNALNPRASFICRLHPRCSDAEKEECSKVLQEFKGDKLIVDSSEFDTSTVIAGSTVVVSVYSLSIIEAAALRTPAISVITESGYSMFASDLGNKLKPCFYDMGCCLEVYNLAELTVAIQQGIAHELSSRIACLKEQALIIDGKNAERVANFLAHDILKL